MNSYRSQRGAALVVALLMLGVLALLGVTAVSNSTVNLRVTQNIQAREDIEANAQNVIEQIISSITPFNTPTAQTASADGITWSSPAPVCTDLKPSTGYSATYALAPEDTHWDVVVTATDSITGSNTTVRQGVIITLPAGSCP